MAMLMSRAVSGAMNLRTNVSGGYEIVGGWRNQWAAHRRGAF
jgi:hypothetical protein